MRILKFEITLEPNEPLHITPYSDVHFGNSNCALSAWERNYASRAKLDNAYFINLGDFNDLILPNDLKRYKPSVQSNRGYDDIINREIDETIDLINSQPNAKWIFWGTGNHEDELEKRHYFNMPKAVAQRLNIPLGLYTGLLVINIKRPKVYGSKYLILAYHHGAWGGVEIAGITGAYRYFSRFQGWDLACYGHNHEAIMKIFPIAKLKDNLELESVNRVVFATGGWLLQAKQNKEGISYSERKGHPIAPITCPLIKIWYDRANKNGNIQTHWTVSY